LSPSAVHEVDLVVFEAGGRRWAADAWDVLRVDRRRSEAPTAFVAPASGYRVLMVDAGRGEVQVPIDRLLGFERVSPNTLRPVPAFAKGLTNRALVGAWLAKKEIVLLIDLQALVKELAS
jgi:chemotaxis signal transduction protein